MQPVSKHHSVAPDAVLIDTTVLLHSISEIEVKDNVAYHTTVPTTSPAPYEEVTLRRQVTAERQTTVSATKRAIVPPYYTSGRQVNTERQATGFATKRAIVPPYYTLGRQVNTERQATGFTTKRAIVPPYYTSGRQVNTELKEGEPEYDYPVIAMSPSCATTV